MIGKYAEPAFAWLTQPLRNSVLTSMSASQRNIASPLEWHTARLRPRPLEKSPSTGSTRTSKHPTLLASHCSKGQSSDAKSETTSSTVPMSDSPAAASASARTQLGNRRSSPPSWITLDRFFKLTQTVRTGRTSCCPRMGDRDNNLPQRASASLSQDSLSTGSRTGSGVISRS